jgi:hypothetical protein
MKPETILIGIIIVLIALAVGLVVTAGPEYRTVYVPVGNYYTEVPRLGPGGTEWPRPGKLGPGGQQQPTLPSKLGPGAETPKWLPQI